jgi:hypothetical protein
MTRRFVFLFFTQTRVVCEIDPLGERGSACPSREVSFGDAA